MIASERDPRQTRRKRLTGLGAAAVAALVLGYVVVQVRGLIAEVAEASATPPASLAPPPPPQPAPELFETSPPRGDAYSNIYKYDYVGPETCGKCHARNYGLWQGHPHSKMNRNATAATVVGDFSGAKLDYGGSSVAFGKDRGQFLMTISRHGKPVRQYQVTRTVGSRFVQMYMGTQTVGPEPEGSPVYTVEVKLPFAYWILRDEWFPQTYDENPGVAEYDDKGEVAPFYSFHGKSTGEWKRVCIKCHNTFPYALRFDAAPNNQLIGFPSGELSLTAKVRWPANPDHRLPEVEPSELVTLGISCESCHFGGREHAQNGAPISFLPRSQDLTAKPRKEADGAEIAGSPQVATASGKSPHAVNSICHQCHAADPQGPLYPDGSASWNSREAEDLMNGACASKIACTDCHNPHQAGPTTVVNPPGPDQPNQVEACLRCHGQYRTPEAAAAHASHPKQVKVSCLDCHLPRLVHGLAGVTRTHRISSPTDPRMLKGDYPNACNLCHLDKSLRWTLEALETGWHEKPALGDGFTPSAEPLGPLWLRHREPVVHQIAAAAYARSPLGKEALALILPLLNEANPPGRMFGVLAVEGILGRRVSVDEYTPWAEPAVRERQVMALRDRTR